MESKIFDTLLEPTFIISREKKVVYCNETAALICDLTVRKILRSQMTLDQVFTFSEIVSALSPDAEPKESSPYQEVSFQTQSGKNGKAQITVQPIKTSDIAEPAWLVYFRDVTLEETLQKKYRGELAQKEDVIKDLENAKLELQNYSKNLEKMVAKRTAELTKLNQMMAALLDSLGQGFLVFDDKGRCQEVYSKACEDTLQTIPKDKYIWEVLKLPEVQIPGFKKWMQTIYGEMLPFEDLAPLGPKTYPHSEGKSIELGYFPLKNSEAQIAGVVVVATDMTSLVEAQREADQERAHAKMIVSLIRHKKQVVGFLREAESILSEIKSEFSAPQIDPDAVFRALHTLKGGAASFSIISIADRCHQGEGILSNFKLNPTLPLQKELKDCCLGIVPLFYHFLEENRDILGNWDKMRERWVETPISRFIDFYQLPEMKDAHQLRAALTENFLMEPIGGFFSHYSEVIQNVAEREDKFLFPLALKNAELKILPEPYEHLFGTLIHAFRNSVDHGIEKSEVRSQMGKNPKGRIEVKFERQKDLRQDWLVIQIVDDGGGISPDKIRDKMKSKNIDISSENDHQVIQHIFDSQFSTKEQVTETSGRGVGMDAILISAQALAGKAWVESQVGQGTTLIIQVPFFDHWVADWKKNQAA